MPKLYVFDFGDTLVSYPLNTWDNQIAFIEGFFAALIERRHLRPDGAKTALQLANELNVEHADHSTRPFVERIRDSRFFGDQIDQTDAEEIEREIVEATCNAAHLFADAHPGMARLRRQGALTGIMSNLPWGTSSATWRHEFARHGFIEGYTVDAIICCVDVGFRKPRPEGLQAIMAKLGIEPGDTVFVGDNPVADAEAAGQAGCRFVFIDRGHYDLKDHENTVASLLDL